MSQFQIMMAGGGGDTTFTKIFVGGLAWETKRDTMRLYFEQFGEILEAVVITDKNTGRSKGYGFVTFKDPESAMRACQNPSPVIDGRRANCNIASFGATKPPHFNGGGRTRPPAAYYQGGGSSLFHHQQQQQQPSAQYTFPYSSLGYTGYTTQNSMYPLKYYNMYGGGQQHQFTLPYYTTTGVGGYYPIYAAQNRQSSPSSHGYGGIQYTVPPQMVQHYPYSSYLPAAQLYYGSTDNILSTTTSNIAATTTFAVPIAATTTTSVTVAAENSHAKKKLAEEEEEEEEENEEQK